jgi:hypothetical protein
VLIEQLGVTNVAAVRTKYRCCGAAADAGLEAFDLPLAPGNEPECRDLRLGDQSYHLAVATLSAYPTTIRTIWPSRASSFEEKFRATSLVMALNAGCLTSKS